MKPSPDERSDGSFMRIEVISLLKLAFMTAAATGFLVFFVILGFSGAPDVSQSDWTSSKTRCTSGFTADNFEKCSASVNVTLPLDVANTTTGIVNELLKLKVREQVDVLGCMVDQCANATNRPLSTDHPENLTFAHYSFGVNGLTQRSRYFYLEVAFPNDDKTRDHSFEVTMIPQVRGIYTEASGNKSYTDLIPDTREYVLEVECEEDELYCESQYFLRFGDIDYDNYKIDVLFNSSTPLPLNGRDPQFRKTWGTEAFTNWMLGIKYFFVIISGLVAIWYNVTMNTLSSREQNMEQGWITALGIALVLFNDPFYFVEASIGGNAMKLLSLLFQVSFFQMLLLFWLIALDNMRLQGCERGVSNSQFFLPKVLYIVLFWILHMLYHGYMKYYGNNDPTWNPLEANSNFTMLRVMIAGMSLGYLGWFAFLSFLSRKEFQARRPRYRFFLSLSFLIVMFAFIGLANDSFSPTPPNGGEWTSAQALFNVYVFMLAYLYAPSATALKLAKQRNGAHGKNSDPEASPALGPPVHPINADQVEMDVDDLDEA
ncbi:hypothetical protein Poli38472_009836 [Pythium oligandrum]|uniref:Wntless-like transmembrane domain-containing protein n=1 Tax=Pythium oligandrum TaxID=41045 RepID=A0A8K1CG13_PYTOL|nr:hypothetical protein Poli38472_009836 [Pythium oligandrum]|eukprot:TMW62343.1 hypothetical protein Poli38472_009836 [Pythium oligandrum]